MRKVAGPGREEVKVISPKSCMQNPPKVLVDNQTTHKWGTWQGLRVVKFMCEAHLDRSLVSLTFFQDCRFNACKFDPQVQ
jgi:hypothetical protein